MSKLFIEDTSLTAIGDAIRAKGGTTELLSVPDGMVAAIAGIEAGGSSGLNIDWENDVVVTVTTAGQTITLPDGYTINDIKLAILPTAGGTSYGSSTRYLFAAPGVLTPEVIHYPDGSAYNNILPAISMGAYGTGSQTGSAGIGLYLTDHQEIFSYSTSYRMRYMGLRSADATPTVLEGYFTTDVDPKAYVNTTNGYITQLAAGKGLIVLKYKEG